MQAGLDRKLTDSLPPIGSYAISGIGLFYAVLWIWYAHGFGYLGAGLGNARVGLDQTLFIVESVILVGLAGGLTYAGYWFRGRDFSNEHRWWGAFWTMTGSIGIVAVVLVVNAHQMAEGLLITPQLLAEEILLGGAGGALGGLLIGIGMAQSRRRADQIARQRDVFEFLNKLLRHNILNSVSVIQGMTDLIAKDYPDEHVTEIETIQRRSASISDLTRNVRHISSTLSDTFETEPIDLCAELRNEVEIARSSFGGATFDTSIPDGVSVRANKALGAVFDNLLSNAVVHNDAEDPRVEVSVEPGETMTGVRVSDNGPGIPPEKRDEIFDTSDHADDGMGLYLVDTLVTAYGGTVEVADNEPRGTTVTVRLPTESQDRT